MNDSINGARSNTAHRALFPALANLKKSPQVGHVFHEVKGFADAINAACDEHNQTLEELARYDTRFNLLIHLYRQREWSERTFGPGDRRKGIIDHIRKELVEIEHAPKDVTEWIDVAILALDGAWRSGATPEQIVEALHNKQIKNEGRVWPDWRNMPVDAAIEHDRSADPQGLPDIEPPVALTEERQTKMLVFSGYSDDTFGEYAATNRDYDNSASGQPIEWLVTSPDGEKLLVVGQYCPGAAGSWLVGVGTPDEGGDDVELPDWPISIEQSERAYSPMLMVNVPVGSTMRCLQDEDGEDEPV